MPFWWQMEIGNRFKTYILVWGVPITITSLYIKKNKKFGTGFISLKLCWMWKDSQNHIMRKWAFAFADGAPRTYV